MDTVLLLARVITAFVLVFAAAAKLVQGASSFRETVVDLGIPTRLAGPVTVVLVPVELAIAVLLLPGPTAWWGAVAAAGLLGAFTTLIAMNLAKGRRPACNCFGQISSEPIGTPTLVRNAFLFSIAVVPAVWSPTDAGPGVLAAARSTLTDASDAALWLTVLAAVVALEAVALLVLHGRKHAVAPEAVDAAPASAGLPVGAPGPDFALPDRHGENRRLADLLEPGVPLMLLFTSPTCAPCTALLPELATWRGAFAGALRIVLLSQGTKDELPPDVEALIDEGGLVAQSYRYVGTPGALILAPDGIVSSPLASGPAAIRGLVARTRADLALDGSVPLGELAIGEDAPAFTLDTLHGHPVSLSDYAGSLVLLVFWDSTCGYCHRLLPELRRWEAERPAAGVHLVLVSIGTEEGLRAQGWQSHVALDPGSLVTKSYGGFGTPTARLVDASGRVASDLAVGADEVLALAARAEQLARLAESFSSN